jgi:hypothetical protein
MATLLLLLSYKLFSLDNWSQYTTPTRQPTALSITQFDHLQVHQVALQPSFQFSMYGMIPHRLNASALVGRGANGMMMMID